MWPSAKVKAFWTSSLAYCAAYDSAAMRRLLTLTGTPAISSVISFKILVGSISLNGCHVLVSAKSSSCDCVVSRSSLNMFASLLGKCFELEVEMTEWSDINTTAAAWTHLESVLLIDPPLLRSSADNFNLHRTVVVSITSALNSPVLTGNFSSIEITASFNTSFDSIAPKTIFVCSVFVRFVNNTSTLDAYQKRMPYV